MNLTSLKPRGVTARGATSRRLGRAAAGATLAVALVTGSGTWARAAPDSFADLAEQVSPAVVNISVLQERQPQEFRGGQGMPFPPDSPYHEFFERFFGPEGPRSQRRPPRRRQARGLGSGFIIDAAGYVVTNHHVIDGAEKITVTLSDGKALEAALIGSDRRSDLALLKVEPKDPLPFVSFADSDEIRVGDWVMAVGNPFGLGGTVTAGIVSARGRDLQGDSIVDFLQTDAPINRGNSGGPTFDGAGDVVGINTAIFSPNGGSIGLGFAIPANTAKPIIAQLRATGKVARGWLGVRIQPVTEEIAEGFGLDDARGALIASVEYDSPAERAGLRPGDVVLAWDGKPVEKVKDLSRLVAATAKAHESEITIWRDRGEATLAVVTGALEEQRVGAAAGPSQPVLPSGLTAVPETGLAVAELTDDRRRRFGVAPEIEGVLVAEVAPGSQAAEAGLRQGDVIESIDLAPVAGPAELAEEVIELRDAGRDVVPLMISRQGGKSFLSLRIGAA